jgi:hypothetical protein
MLEPEELRIVPSESTRPMLEPLPFLTVPPDSILPTLDPDELRIVPSESTRPMLEPEPLRTVIEDQAQAGTTASSVRTVSTIMEVRRIS